MKKMFKSSLSVLLVLIMALSGAVVAFAQPEPKASVGMGDYSVSSTNALGDVFVQAMEEGAETAMADFAVTDVTMDGKIATVSLNNATPCTVVVGLYQENHGELYGVGVRDVAADAGTVNVAIKIDVIPQYFLLKAFLLDSETEAPLCQEYMDIESTQAFENFSKKNVDDFKEEAVINFDDSKEDNFAVLVDGAVTTTGDAEHNVLESADEEKGEYVLSNADASVTSLKKGDIFKLENGDEMVLVKVDSVTVEDGKVTITEQKDATYEDFFTYIDIQESGGDKEGELEIDMSKVDEGIEFAGFVPWEDETQVVAQSDPLIEDNVTGKISPKFVAKKVNIIGSAVTLNFDVKLDVTFNINVFYDVNLKWDFWNSTECLFFQMTLDVTLKGSVSLSGKLQHDFLLAEGYYVTPVGIVITVDFDVHIEVSASVTFQIKAFTFRLGFRYVEGQGFQNLCKKPEFDFTPELSGDVTIKFALKPIPKLSLIKIVALEVQNEFGVKVEVNLFTINAAEALGTKEPDKLHTCKSGCYEGAVYIYFGSSIDGTIFGKKIVNFKLCAEVSKKISDIYVRTNPFSVTFSICPNMARKIEYTVVNKNGKPIKNMDVQSGAPDYGQNYIHNVTNATDDSGKVAFYYPEGEFTASFLLDGAVVHTQAVRMLKNSLTVKVVVDTTVTDGKGSGHKGFYDVLGPGGAEDFDGDFMDLNVGDIIKFGAYPQSKVTDNTTILRLEAKGGSVEWTAYPYYISGTKPDYMFYKDIQLGTSFYRGVMFRNYRPSFMGDPSFTNLSFQDESGYNPGFTYWFKYEPLEWRVLNPYSGLVLCESIIDSQDFHHTTSKHSDGKYASNWGKSDLCAWLNGGFMDTAFNEKEKRAIAETTVDSMSPNGSSYDAGKSTNQIFLLSYYEVQNATYGFTSDTARQATGTDYAKCQGLYVNTGHSIWSLRSPASDGSAYLVSCNGYTFSERVCYTQYGIRPALQFNLGAVISQSEKATTVQAQAEMTATRSVQQGVAYTANCTDAVAGNEYILLVRQEGTTGVTADNIAYIDQMTATGENLPFTYVPGMTASVTVEVVGDFGDGAERRSLVDTTHTHSYKNAYNETSHWTECDCGEKTAPVSHSLSAWTVSKPATTTAKGEKKRTCACGYSETEEIPVIVSKVESVTCDGGTVQYKSALTLSPKVTTTGDAKYDIVYTSSDSKVASVDKNGNITTHKKGTVTITCTITNKDDPDNVVETTCKVTVKYAWWQMLIRILLLGFLWY